MASPQPLASSLVPAGTRGRLLVAWLCLGVGLWSRDGTLAPLAMLGLLGCLTLLGLVGRSLEPSSAAAEAKAGPDELVPRSLWLLLLGVPMVLNLKSPIGSALTPDTSWLPHSLLVVGLGAVGLYGVRRGDRGALALLAALAYLAVGTYLLRHTPDPHIDVFDIQQRGAAELLAGHDPYTVSYPNHYSPEDTARFFGKLVTAIDAYPYPPLSLLLTTVGYRLCGDVRASFLVLHTLTGLLLYLLGRRRGLGLGLLCLHLLHPRGFLVIERAWTEPLLAACLALWVAGRDLPRRKRPTLGAALGEGVRLALLLSAKQYSALILPLLVPVRFAPHWLRSRRWLAVALALTLTAGLLAAFLLWHPADFIADIVQFQMRQPFRPDSLSFPALFYKLTDFQAPGALAVVGAGLALAWVWRRLPDGTSGLLLGLLFAVVGVFVFAKQAFCNYYYFVGVVMLLNVAVAREAATDAARVPAGASPEAQ